MYFVIPQIILFREEHSPRTLVDKVDFISAPGHSEENIHRPGGPKFLLTNRALFKFNKQKKRFCLLKIHNKESLENVINLTGFKFDVDNKVTNMTFPNKTRIDILRNKISYMVSEFYPEFADRVWGV